MIFWMFVGIMYFLWTLAALLVRFVFAVAYLTIIVIGAVVGTLLSRKEPS